MKLRLALAEWKISRVTNREKKFKRLCFTSRTLINSNKYQQTVKAATLIMKSFECLNAFRSGMLRLGNYFLESLTSLTPISSYFHNQSSSLAALQSNLPRDCRKFSIKIFFAKFRVKIARKQLSGQITKKVKSTAGIE